MNDNDHQSFSFSRSAEDHKETLSNETLEATIRPPNPDKESFFHQVEQDAQNALGLSKDSPFLVIQRVRLLKDKPTVIHRVFLNPARFPQDFLKHDFKTKSLIDLYRQSGYEPAWRDTVLKARLLNPEERNLLIYKFNWKAQQIAVLDAEQQMYSRDRNGQTFLLEYLKATYMDGWKYEIKNRTA